MEFIIVFLSILLLIGLILFQYSIAMEFYKIAIMKGYEDRKYLWMSFAFGIVGYLLVIALPNKDVFIEETSDKTDEIPETFIEINETSNKINDIIETLSETSEIIENVNGLYIKEIETSKNIRPTVEINGKYYSHSDWLSEGKIKWYKADLKIYGIKEKTANVPYTLKFELVEEGLNITGFPDEIYNGLYVKK